MSEGVETYAVQTVMALRDEFTPPLLRLAAAARSAAADVKDLQGTLAGMIRSLNPVQTEKFGASILGVVRDLKALRAAMPEAESSAAVINSLGLSMRRAAGGAAELSRGLSAVARAEAQRRRGLSALDGQGDHSFAGMESASTVIAEKFGLVAEYMTTAAGLMRGMRTDAGAITRGMRGAAEADAMLARSERSRWRRGARTLMRGTGNAIGAEAGEAMLGGGMGMAGGVGGIAGAMLVGASVHQGMAMEDYVNRAMVTMGLPMGPDYMKTPEAADLSRAIAGAARDWGQSNLGGLQDAALGALRSLAPLAPEQRIKLLPAIMDFVGTEVTGKPGTTPEEAAESAIGLAHQLKAYTPEKIAPLFKAFAQASMASPDSLDKLNRMFSYSLPLLTSGLNMDPGKLMAMGIAGSQMGLGSKSGTWLSQLFSRSVPDVADLTQHHQRARLQGLVDLGLLRNGRLTAVGGDGRLDPFLELKTISQAMQGMTPAKRMAAMQNAFGMQGSREAALLSDPAALGNLLHLYGNIEGARTPEELKRAYGESPKMKWEKAAADFNLQLANLGEKVLPAFTGAVVVATDVLKKLLPASFPDKSDGAGGGGWNPLHLLTAPYSLGGMALAAMGMVNGHPLGNGPGLLHHAPLVAPTAPAEKTASAPGAQQPVHLHTTVQVDGRDLASASAAYWLRDQSGAATGPAHADARGVFLRPGDK